MVFYVEKLPFKGMGTPNTQCLLVWKDLDGSELNKDKSGLGSKERRQRALA